MKRVVITGLGALTPIGNSVDEFWQNAINGKSGVSKISKFDPTLFKTSFASELKGFSPETKLNRNEIKRSDRFTQYALYSAAEAIEDSGFDLQSLSPFDIGVIWGSGQGGMQTFEDEVINYAENDLHEIWTDGNQLHCGFCLCLFQLCDYGCFQLYPLKQG